MLALQFEICVVMVEFAGFPVFIIVTTQAALRAISLELGMVRVLVAVQTARIKTIELLYCHPVLTNRKMAITAGLPFMFSLECIPGDLMIERDIFPAANLMAILTGGLRIVFFVNAGFMDIFMAITAFYPNIPELPFRVQFIFMAKKAWCRHMGAFQGEFGLLMLFKSECRGCKPGYIVAVGTIQMAFSFQQLPFMIILMAIHAIYMSYRIRVFALMACLAVDSPVFSLQGESCPVMVDTARAY